MSRLEGKEILIIEDEFHAADRLKKLIAQLTIDCKINGPIDTVEDAVEYFEKGNKSDLIFMDIQLADGISFSIFNQTQVVAPVIFTTAFDEYSLKAFKVNSIDYLMKPIDENELKAALAKFQKLNFNYNNLDSIQILLKNIQKNENYKERFLIKWKDTFSVIKVNDIAYFYSEDSVTFLVDHDGKSHIYDQTLNQIEQDLNPKKFFRINRKQIVNIKSIFQIHSYFNNRVKLDLRPIIDQDVLVSRDKVKAFKTWLDK